MSRCSSATHSPGRIPVAGGKEHHCSEARLEPLGDRIDLLPGFERAFLGPPPLWVLDPLLGRVDVEHPPHDRAGEHLAKRLGCLEPVAGRDRRPPGGDLDRVELAEPVVTERRDGASEQEAQLLERHRRGLVLLQVLVDKLGQGERSAEPALAQKPFERPLEGRPRVLRARETTPLHPPRPASTYSITVGPPHRAPVARVERKHLSLLRHCNHLRLWGEERLQARAVVPRRTRRVLDPLDGHDLAPG